MSSTHWEGGSGTHAPPKQLNPKGQPASEVQPFGRRQTPLTHETPGSGQSAFEPHNSGGRQREPVHVQAGGQEAAVEHAIGVHAPRSQRSPPPH